MVFKKKKKIFYNENLNYLNFIYLINKEFKYFLNKFKLKIYLTKEELDFLLEEEEKEKKRKEEEERLKELERLKEEIERLKKEEIEKQELKKNPHNRFLIPTQKEKKKPSSLKVPTTEEEKQKLLNTPITNPLYLKVMEGVREEELRRFRKRQRRKMKVKLKKFFYVYIKNNKIEKINKKKIKNKYHRPFILYSKHINSKLFSILKYQKNFFLKKKNFFNRYYKYYFNIMNQYRINNYLSINIPKARQYDKNNNYNLVKELYNYYIDKIKSVYFFIKRFRKKNIYINIIYFYIPKKKIINYNPSYKNIKYLNIYWNKNSFYNKLIGFLIKHGKRIKAELIINNSFNLIKELIYCNPILFLYKCIYNSIPLFIFDVKKKKNVSLFIPKIIPYEKRINIALRKISKEIRNSVLSRNLKKTNKLNSSELLYNSLISHFFLKGKIKKELLLNIKNAFINKHLFKTNSDKILNNYNLNKLFKYSSFKKIKRYKF
jgi:ribosomal protein S7